MLNKCRNNVPKYGYDSRKINSIMVCFVRGRKSASPCSFHTVLQAAAYRVNDCTHKYENMYLEANGHDLGYRSTHARVSSNNKLDKKRWKGWSLLAVCCAQVLMFIMHVSVICFGGPHAAYPTCLLHVILLAT